MGENPLIDSWPGRRSLIQKKDSDFNVLWYFTGMKTYELFLFDLDDTLLDFRASEKLSFHRTMEGLGLKDQSAALFAEYQIVNPALWKLFEEGKVTKDHLKV